MQAYQMPQKKNPEGLDYHQMPSSRYLGKRVLVVGMARSGVGAALLLCKLGATPVLNDIKPREAFGDKLDELNNLPVEWRMAEDPVPLLDECDMLIISPGVPIDSPVVLAAKAKDKYMIGELEFAAQNAQGALLAITGTNGKTTTVTLLGEIFKAAGKLAFVAGNVGYPLSLAAMESRREDVLIAEVSSFQLESVDTFHPVAAAVLNVTEDHLIRHYTMDNYIALKKRVFENQTPQDVAVLNFDDPICYAMAEGQKAQIAWFSRLSQVDQGAFVENGNVTVRWKGEEKTICRADEIKIPGPHNLENALAAVMIAYVRGVPAPVIRHALRTFPGVEHRIEKVRDLDGVEYINDSKGTNADSTIKAVDTMRAPTVLILGGYDKHVSFKALAEHIRQSPQIADVVLIGATAPQLEKELLAADYHHISHAKTLEEAVALSRSLAVPGGNVLLSPACASFDMFSDYEQRGRVFKDIVNHL